MEKIIVSSEVWGAITSIVDCQLRNECESEKLGFDTSQ